MESPALPIPVSAPDASRTIPAMPGEVVPPPYDVQFMLRALAMRMDGIEDRLGTGADRMTTIETDLAKNTAATGQVATSTRELVELFQSFKGGFKVLGVLGVVAKWVAAIAGACTGIYAMVHAGDHASSINEARPK